MTSVTFENASFAEIIKRADKITPKKGEAFDKASGIVLDVDPSQEWGVTVRATNLEVFYTEWATPLEKSGEKATWRLSSVMLVGMVTKLPIGTGKTVKLEQIGNMLHVSSGRFRGKMMLMDSQYYPTWQPFDPGGTAPVADLGSRLEQVAWATSKSAPGEPISGIRFNGETLVATDKYKLASVPCRAPHIDREVTVAASTVGTLMKQMGDTNVGVLGNYLVFMPNEYTQIKCLIFDGKYPAVERVMSRDHAHFVTVNKNLISEYVGRVVIGNQKDRIQSLTVYIGLEELAFHAADPQGIEGAGDVIEVPGQATHERFKFSINPSALTEAVMASPGEQVKIHYTPGEPRKILLIQGAADYECWVVPRAGGDQGEQQ